LLHFIYVVFQDGSTKTIGKEKLQTLSDSEMDGFSGLETENINRKYEHVKPDKSTCLFYFVSTP
jgi:hypothetical protein